MSKRHVATVLIVILAGAWFVQGMAAWWTRLAWGGLMQALILTPLLLTLAYKIYFSERK